MRTNPYLAILVSFAGLIVTGALALLLPLATVDGKGLGLFDALFMATSATCVTGLATVDVGSFLSPAGQAILLLLVQVGGLGFMTFSSFVLLLLRSRPHLTGKIMVREVLNQVTAFHPRALLLQVMAFTFGLEALGAALLWFRMEGEGTDRAWSAVFHAVCAFCNAGFSLHPDNLVRYCYDPLVNLTVMGLIVAGGLGFWVLHELWEAGRDRLSNRPSRPLGLQTQVVLIMSAGLIVVGAVLFVLVEAWGTQRGGAPWKAIWPALFQSVTPRTAGFMTVDTASLATPTLLWIMVWMFIGASPGSCGGGVKTTTFAVMMASFRAALTEAPHVRIRRSSLADLVVRRAHAVFLAAGALVFATFFVMSLGGVKPGHGPFLPVLFETVSAFGTVGLSMGVTPFLTALGKVVLSLLMYAGRVGPLTLVLVLAQRQERPRIEYPEQSLPVG